MALKPAWSSGDPSEDQPSDPWFALALTAAFVCLAAPVVAHHEMWGDELQAWLIARDSASVPALFRHLKYEGHPGLWHLSLYALQRIVSPSPTAMQWLHLGIAAAAVAVVGLAAPFSRVQRALFALGYYPFYEYAVIARNYAPAVLLTVVACALVSRAPPRLGAAGVVLLLLAHTNVFGTITAAGLCAGLAAEWLIGRRRGAPHEGVRDRGLLLALGLGALGIVTAAWQMKPPPDYGFAVGWHLGFEYERLRLVLRIPAFAFLPVHPEVRDFWNRMIVGEHVWIKRAAIVLSLALLGWTARLAVRRPVAFAWYVCTVAACLAFYYAKYIGTLRHYGTLIVMVVAAHWLVFARTGRTAASKERGLRAAGVVFTAFLAVQAVAGVTTAWLDWRYVFSNAARVAALAERPDLAGCILAGTGTPTDVGVAAILGFMPPRRAYYVRTERFESYVIWDVRSMRRITDSLAVGRARRLAAEEGRGVLLIVPWPLAGVRGAPPLVGDFTGSAVPEDFYVYGVAPPDAAAARDACRLPR
jgi:hypothetical protein